MAATELVDLEQEESIISNDSFWDTAERAHHIARAEWTVVARLIPDILWLGSNFACLFYSVIAGQIVPSGRLGAEFGAVIAFCAGLCGFILLYIAFTAGDTIQSACITHDVQKVIKSLCYLSTW